ncbi:MAG: hypothetical protein EBS53_03475 [Bacteroidetes bacterium]|nr:hypothetical protein [Bacteroidota bacterium]
MQRREKLILSALNGKAGDKEAKYLDAVVKLVLSDMGGMYLKFWDAEGPGVMCFEPENKERSMFYMTLKELHAAQESCEREDNGDLAETFRRILVAAQKIDPAEKAGYIINDAEGIRYLEIDYNQAVEQ